jgi:hypothetical protein
VSTASSFNARHILVIAAAIATLVVSLSAIALPGRPFTHYLLFLFWPVAMLAGALWPRGSFVLGARKLPLIVGSSAACGLVLAMGWYPRSVFFPNLSVTGIERLRDAGDVFPWKPAGEGGLLIWGWMPDWYVMSSFYPATRDIHTYNQIIETPFRNYFRSRLIGDFNTNRPALVVDAVAPGSFGFIRPQTEGIRIFPELAGLIDQGYAAVSSSPNCPRIYLRKDLVADREKSFAKIRKIEASSYLESEGRSFRPELVDDWQTFETCPDRWLLPDGQLGELRIELDREETVAAVRILNTRNEPFYDRAARSALVRLQRDGKTVFEVPTRVRRYPYWTEISVPSLRADAVQIIVTAFEGRGGGLNEVKIVPLR